MYDSPGGYGSPGLTAVHTTSNGALLIYNTGANSGAMRVATTIGLQDGTNESRTLAAHAYGTRVGVVLAYTDTSNYLYVEIESQLTLRIYKVVAGSETLLAATHFDAIRDFGKSGIQASIYLDACFDGTTVKANVCYDLDFQGADDFPRNLGLDGGSGRVYSLQAEVGSFTPGQQAGVKTRTLTGGSGIRVNFFNFRLAYDRDGAGWSGGCVVCSCGPYHYQLASGFAFNTTSGPALNSDVWEVRSGTWTTSGTQGELRTSTGGLILSKWSVIPSGRSMMANIPWIGKVTATAGNYLRVIVDCIDEDNYHCAQFSYDAGGGFPYTLKLIKRVAGAETVLYSKSQDAGTTGQPYSSLLLTGVFINSAMIFASYAGNDVSNAFTGNTTWGSRPWAITSPIGGRRFGISVNGTVTAGGGPTTMQVRQVADPRYPARCGEPIDKIIAGFRGITGNAFTFPSTCPCSLLPTEFSVQITNNGGYNGTYSCVWNGTDRWIASGGSVTVYMGIGTNCYVIDGSGQYKGALPDSACDELNNLECLPFGDSFSSAATTGAKAYVTAV